MSEKIHGQEFIQGSEEFQSAFTESAPQPEAAPEPKQIPLTVAPDGSIVGGMDNLPDEQRAQLESPESQAQIKRMYKDWKYGNEAPKKPKMIHESSAVIGNAQWNGRDLTANLIDRVNGRTVSLTRDLRQHNGLPSRVARKLRRQHLRKLAKINNKFKGALSHGSQSDESNISNSRDGRIESSGIGRPEANDGIGAAGSATDGQLRPDGIDSIDAHPNYACGPR